MKILSIIFSLICVSCIKSFDDLDLDEAFESEYEYSVDPTDTTVSLGRDDFSGCLCRKYLLQNYTSCYDPIACKRFPKTRNITTDKLKITTSHIEELSEGDFFKNLHFTSIKIEGNTELYAIHAGTFHGMKNLTKLTIRNNKKLTYLENGTFLGLESLRFLKLSHNGFVRFLDFTNALSYKSLPSLLNLTIVDMVLLKVNQQDFSPMENTSLKILNLNTCNIGFIHPKSFSIFKNLKTLTLGENIITEDNLVNVINGMSKDKINISYLSLVKIGLDEFPNKLLETIGKTNITRLNLSENLFGLIPKFPSMPNLERLDLDAVLTFNIVPDAFKLLPNLKILHMERNKFTEIPEALLLPQLIYLDISYAELILRSNTFLKMKNLKLLNLSGNPIKKLSFESFVGLSNLQQLGLQNCRIFFIDPYTFKPLTNLRILDVQDNAFPSRGIHSQVFTGLEKLLVLLMGNCQISDNFLQIPHLFSHLKSLQLLDLKRNKITNLHSPMWSRIRNLTLLDVSHNNIISWSQRIFLHNKPLKTLVGYSNRISVVTSSMILDFINLEKLDLTKNQFSCECAAMRYLINCETTEKFSRLKKLLASSGLTCAFPEEYANVSLITYYEQTVVNKLCEQKTNWFIIGIIIFFAAILLTIVITMYWHRYHIIYFLFITKIYLTRTRSFNSKESNYQYDAFVSYSNEDRNFVVTLVEMLENQEPYYKLCVYERDFLIGTVISESILSSVAKSRKILLVVSDSFIKSQWCRWEAQVAQNKRIFFKNDTEECLNDSIIIVRLGEIQTNRLTPMLRYLMKTLIYLEWETCEKKQKTFWRKLRLALGFKRSISTIACHQTFDTQ